MKIFCGSSHPSLSKDICRKLKVSPSKLVINSFANSETYVEIQEPPECSEALVIQAICSPVNEYIFETLLICNALKNSGVKKINLLMPYFPYSRQHNKNLLGTAISAEVLTRLFQTESVNKIITIDLHSQDIKSFNSLSFTDLNSIDFFQEHFISSNYEDAVIIAPDKGAINRAEKFAQKLNLNLVCAEKNRIKRDNCNSNNNQELQITLNASVNNKTCIIVDDMVDSASTLCAIASVLKSKGAKKIISYCSHPILSKGSLETINNSEIDKLIVLNTMDTVNNLKSKKIEVVNSSHILSKTILELFPILKK